MRIKKTRLDELVPADRNPRTHSLADIERSIRELGFNDPPCVDERTGKLVEGHGRVEALSAMMRAKQEPPRNVGVDKDGMWTVPVLRGISFASDAEAEKYILAHNRLVEKGGWDATRLAAIFEDMKAQDVSVIGWGEKDVARILESMSKEAPPDFKEHGEFMNTQYTCPKCGYCWNKS